MTALSVNRHVEQGFVQERSERLLQDEGDWFFATRRGVEQGLYTNEMEARLALREFIEEPLRFKHCSVEKFRV